MPPEVSVCWVGGGGRREVQQCGGSSVHPAADLQRDRFTQQHSTEAGLPGPQRPAVPALTRDH